VGLTVLDAGIIIAVLDADDVHHRIAREALHEALERGDQLALPASAYAEVMVGPQRHGQDTATTVDAFIDALPAAVEPATRDIARQAAALRARHGRSLRLPDALVLATATVLGADSVLTTDAGWPDTGVDVRIVGPDHAGR
jgi:predicted nucleic acid-binding protein